MDPQDNRAFYRSEMPTQTTVLEGDLTPAQEKGYVYLPFEVPAQATRIEVEYAYSHQIDSDPLLKGGNTIDLGVFDARGIEFLTAGFRGWTGSERLSFFITEREATPGYLAGPLPAGTWHVLLGLYKIAPEGCHYHVAVTVSTESESAAHTNTSVSKQDLPASPVAYRSGKWLRGEMHCHTLHSDGDSEPQDVVRLARERGLDFLAITDHNSLSCQRVLETMTDPGLILIRGIEVTTFKGHFNAWGIADWVDFRVTEPEHMVAAIGFAKEHGALTACNHPKPFGPPWDYADVEDYDCIEVWNGPWQANNESSLKFWTERLAQGKRIVATGGSDWHDHEQLQRTPPRAPGVPTLWVNVPETPSAATILAAIRRGHVALADEPNGALLDFTAIVVTGKVELTVRGGDILRCAPDSVLSAQVHCQRGAGHTLQLLDQNGVLFTQRVAEADEIVTVQLNCASSLYVRAELRDDDGNVKALTNPIYLERGERGVL